LTIAMNLMAKDPQGTGTIIYILGNGLLWAIVVIPTALIGQLFKSGKVYSLKMRMIRGGVLVAIGLLTFVVVHSSQQPTPTQVKAFGKNDPRAVTDRGFQPWVER